MQDNRFGICLVLLGMSFFSVQDVLIKHLAEYGSLLQIHVMRGLIGTAIITLFLYLGKKPLKFGTAYPRLTFIRATLFFLGFMNFYFALSLIPLAEATALFFTSPFFITIFSKIFFKNEIGWYRWAAISIGFSGTLLIVKPGLDQFNWVYVLPVLTSLAYSASMLIAKMTREHDTAFQQTTHLYVASVIYGMLTYAAVSWFGLDFNGIKGLDFVFRPWTFTNIPVLLAMTGVAVVGTCGILSLISAYRIALPPVIAPFEYVLVVVACAAGYIFFGEVPDFLSVLGMGIIVSCGVFIFIREEIRGKPFAVRIRLR